MIVRASELHKIMGQSKTKDPLSETAKSFIIEKAWQEVTGVENRIESKEMSKGIMCEDEAIDLINTVLFKNYSKNDIRLGNEYMTGECDIVNDTLIRDIKNAWSLHTFPSTQSQLEKTVKKSGYDWQLRAYMMLYDRGEAWVDYCIVDTPSELIPVWEDEKPHRVEHIEPRFRVTSLKIERDTELENKIIERIKISTDFYNEVIKEFENKNL
jgi:hypothetical protein